MPVGYKVDEDLLNGDVRMTMGGEPTFVSIDDMESAANGIRPRMAKKNVFSPMILFSICVNRFGPHGMIHYGQGKWYPGEPLPRWAIWFILA